MRIAKIQSPIVNWIGGILFVLFILWGIGRTITLNNRGEQSGDVIDLRDGNIITLRLPRTRAPFQTVHIYEEGYAIRVARPEQTNSSATRIVLTAQERQILEQFRQQWCTSLPAFRALQANEPYYDIGVRCDGYTVKQTRAPSDMLPTALDTILQRLPALPTAAP